MRSVQVKVDPLSDTHYTFLIEFLFPLLLPLSSYRIHNVNVVIKKHIIIVLHKQHNEITVKFNIFRNKYEVVVIIYLISLTILIATRKTININWY